MLDFHISIGNILEIIAFLGGGMAAWSAMKTDMRVMKHDLNNLDQKVDSLDESMKTLSNILVRVAVQDERLSGIEEDIKELRHGKGFIK